LIIISEILIKINKHYIVVRCFKTQELYRNRKENAIKLVYYNLRFFFSN